MSELISGKDGIKLIKQIFGIEQKCIKAITIEAYFDSAVELTIESFGKKADIKTISGHKQDEKYEAGEAVSYSIEVKVIKGGD